MCTVSIIRLPNDVIRLACNRDEQRSRPIAIPPKTRSFGDHHAIMPIDPAGGGTWIAANDAGVAMTLLNLNEPGKSSMQKRRSRGEIIPSLMSCSSVDEALSASSMLELSEYGPFKLVLVDREMRAEIVSDENQAVLKRFAWDNQPLLYTSSSLGDDLVFSPRKKLFKEILHANGVNARSQNAYHRHSWKNHPHLSVCMRRADARTVSHTIVEIGPELVGMWYHPAPPDEFAADECTILPLAEGVLV